MIHGELSFNTKYTDGNEFMIGLSAYGDDSQSDSEDKVTPPQARKTDVRAFFAQSLPWPFPSLLAIFSFWNRMTH